MHIEFTLSVIIWYNDLVQVIIVRVYKGKNIDINISNDIFISLNSYRQSGFMKTKIIANNFAEKLELN